MANSVDPGEPASYNPSHLDLHFFEKVSVLVYRDETIKFSVDYIILIAMVMFL